MVPYTRLARLGLLRRLREIAAPALDAYGLSGARLAFQQYSGNVIFRVQAPGLAPLKGEHPLYTPDRYNLRILAISYTDTERG
jgi:hypothetical protein